MSKKAKREQKPTPVGEAVAAEMETRAAYQNLIQSFTSDQHELEVKIKEIEQLLCDSGYRYKYEDCRDFKYEVENEKHIVTMIKSEEFKRYEFRDNSSRDILQAIYEQSKKTNNKLFPSETKGVIRKPNGFCDADWKRGLDENAVWD